MNRIILVILILKSILASKNFDEENQNTLLICKSDLNVSDTLMSTKNNSAFIRPISNNNQNDLFIQNEKEYQRDVVSNIQVNNDSLDTDLSSFDIQGINANSNFDSLVSNKKSINPDLEGLSPISEISLNKNSSIENITDIFKSSTLSETSDQESLDLKKAQKNQKRKLKKDYGIEISSPEYLYDYDKDNFQEPVKQVNSAINEGMIHDLYSGIYNAPIITLLERSNDKKSSEQKEIKSRPFISGKEDINKKYINTSENSKKQDNILDLINFEHQEDFLNKNHNNTEPVNHKDCKRESLKKVDDYITDLNLSPSTSKENSGLEYKDDADNELDSLINNAAENQNEETDAIEIISDIKKVTILKSNTNQELKEDSEIFEHNKKFELDKILELEKITDPNKIVKNNNIFDPNKIIELKEILKSGKNPDLNQTSTQLIIPDPNQTYDFKTSDDINGGTDLNTDLLKINDLADLSGNYEILDNLQNTANAFILNSNIKDEDAEIEDKVSEKDKSKKFSRLVYGITSESSGDENYMKKVLLDPRSYENNQFITINSKNQQDSENFLRSEKLIAHKISQDSLKGLNFDKSKSAFVPYSSDNIKKKSFYKSNLQDNSVLSFNNEIITTPPKSLSDDEYLMYNRTQTPSPNYVKDRFYGSTQFLIYDSVRKKRLVENSNEYSNIFEGQNQIRSHKKDLSPDIDSIRSGSSVYPRLEISTSEFTNTYTDINTSDLTDNDVQSIISSSGTLDFENSKDLYAISSKDNFFNKKLELSNFNNVNNILQDQTNWEDTNKGIKNKKNNRKKQKPDSLKKINLYSRRKISRYRE